MKNENILKEKRKAESGKAETGVKQSDVLLSAFAKRIMGLAWRWQPAQHGLWLCGQS